MLGLLDRLLGRIPLESLKGVMLGLLDGLLHRILLGSLNRVMLGLLNGLLNRILLGSLNGVMIGLLNRVLDGISLGSLNRVMLLLEFHLDHSTELCVEIELHTTCLVIVGKNFDKIKFNGTKFQKLVKLVSQFGYLNFSTQNNFLNCKKVSHVIHTWE